MIIKRGRKAGIRNKSYKKPGNLAFWKLILINKEQTKDFLKRGSDNQKETIKQVLRYLKRAEIEFYDEIEGDKILGGFK